MLPIGARRTFRLGSVVAVSLAAAYGLGMQFPYFAPLFALLLTAAPAPPLDVRGLLGLAFAVALTLGVGLLLTPLLDQYAASALLIIAAGLYLSTIVSIGQRKNLIGSLLAMGLTLVPAAGLVEYAIAIAVIQALLLGITLAILSQWIVYPFFPEDPARGAAAKPAPAPDSQLRWIALRATLIVLPPVLFAFSNPGLYMPLIMKSVLLGQQETPRQARAAGRELLGATFLAGLIAILFWFALKIRPNLWIFFLLMLLLGICVGAKVYGVAASRFSSVFWVDVAVNFFILLGPAVEDSASGKDPYKAFAVRFSLFVVVTLYAWAAIAVLEWLRTLQPAEVFRRC
jgi:hypothetical protein